MKSRVIIRIGVSVAILLALISIAYRVEANFTNPLTVNFAYPLTSLSPGSTTKLGASGAHQVFRTGSVASIGVFVNVDPKNNISPGGTSISYLSGSAASVGATDFVYAFKIKNSPDSTVPLFDLRFGTCPGARITSVGYVRDTSGLVVNPTDGSFAAGQRVVFFNFNDPDVIPTNKESTILFYTSPDPPALVTSFIGGGLGTDVISVNVDQAQKVYGACPVLLTVDKKVGCDSASVSDNPLNAIAGSPLVYNITVRNTGQAPLTSLVINDSLLGGNINSNFTVNSAAFTGALTASQTAIATINTTAQNSVTNTVTVNGNYVIPNQDGTPSGQTIGLSDIPAAVLTDSTVLTVFPQPSLQTTMTVTPNSFVALPQTLTFTLKATNSGTGALATVLDVNPKLKTLLATPPAGLTVNGAPSFPTVSQNLAAGAMTTATFTVSVTSLAGWQALADAGNVGQASFALSATGTIPGAAANTCGGNSVTSNATAQINFTPPCSITLEKLVACDGGTGTPADSAFAGNIVIYPNAKVYYRYKVTNSSLLDAVTNITVSDATVLSTPLNIGTLNAGAMKIVDVPATISNPVGSIIGNAVATGSCAHGSPTANAETTVQIVAPKITAQQNVNGGDSVTNYQAGTPLVFSFTATNDLTSGTPLNLTIDDPVLKNIAGLVVKDGANTVTLPYTVNNVVPGGSVTLTLTVTFATQADFLAIANSNGTLKNGITVQAALPNNITACSMGANAPVLSATTETTVSVVLPPSANEICIISDCAPNCPVIPSGQSALIGTSASDTKAGSLLFYNIYTSDPSGASAQDTALTLTNTGPKTIFAHMFMIDGKSCSTADFYACLSPAQTSWWLASELDPGITGYALAVAVNDDGAPISFNYLIGGSRVKFKSGHMSVLNAISYAAMYPHDTILPGFVAGAETAELKLDGIQYNQAATAVSVDNLASPADKNSTLLILNPVGGDLSSSETVNTIGALTGQVYDENERGYSFQANENTCQVRKEINDNFIRIPFRFSKVIKSSTSGTIRLKESQGKALSGAVINFNPDVLTAANAYSQGHNLHNLTISNQAKYIIPIFRPHS